MIDDIVVDNDVERVQGRLTPAVAQGKFQNIGLRDGVDPQIAQKTGGRLLFSLLVGGEVGVEAPNSDVLDHLRRQRGTLKNLQLALNDLIPVQGDVAAHFLPQRMEDIFAAIQDQQARLRGIDTLRGGDGQEAERDWNQRGDQEASFIIKDGCQNIASRMPSVRHRPAGQAELKGFFHSMFRPPKLSLCI
ncbi:hypothetical protein [Gluconacetobacter sacchari]|uniref:hypothetical protein n=1 Tax=Gluconacetobacter sacchari TaxID=92759 RepID=UPI002231016C|nr:hypothetical protein [Gluconacetobacter sacchari]